MKLNNKELKIIMKSLAHLAKDERLKENEVDALCVLSEFVLNMAGKNIADKYREYFDMADENIVDKYQE